MSLDAASAVSLTEHHHLAEMHENLRRKLQESQRKDAGGRMNSIRADVLAMVVGENYDNAKTELTSYVDYKTAYPGFQARVGRFVQHCCDLIQAINTKRNFPGLASLSLAKQQEIHEKVLEHFEELKHNLKQIEKVERENKLTDMRSTVWVMKAACLVVFGVFVTAFFLDLQSGLFSSSFQVINVLMDESSGWIVNLIRF